eukprot:1363192-Alexandrium_andersonii.AAC.1
MNDRELLTHCLLNGGNGASAQPGKMFQPPCGGCVGGGNGVPLGVLKHGRFRRCFLSQYPGDVIEPSGVVDLSLIHISEPTRLALI